MESESLGRANEILIIISVIDFENEMFCEWNKSFDSIFLLAISCLIRGLQSSNKMETFPSTSFFFSSHSFAGWVDRAAAASHSESPICLLFRFALSDFYVRLILYCVECCLCVCVCVNAFSSSAENWFHWIDLGIGRVSRSTINIISVITRWYLYVFST